jgi:hypothetical protein
MNERIALSYISSQADDYAKNKGGLSQKKAMLMNQVILGNAIKLQEADESLTEVHVLSHELDSMTYTCVASFRI